MIHQLVRDDLAIGLLRLFPPNVYNLRVRRIVRDDSDTRSIQIIRTTYKADMGLITNTFSNRSYLKAMFDR